MKVEKKRFKKDLQKSHELLLQLCSTTLNFGERIIKNGLAFDTAFERVSTFFLIKGHKAFSAAVELAKRGYGEDAANIVRSIFEVLVNYSFIAQDKDKRAELFINHDHLSRKRYLEIVKGQGNKVDPVVEKEILQLAKEVEGEYKSPIYWYNKKAKTIRELAKKANLVDLYDMIYPLYSDIAHSGIKSVSHYIKEEKTGRIVGLYGPSDNFVEFALISGYDCYIRILGEYITSMKLPMEEELQAILDRSVTILKKHKEKKK